jgi:hypothetical protein
LNPAGAGGGFFGKGMPGTGNGAYGGTAGNAAAGTEIVT